MNHFASALSLNPDLDQAVAEVVAEAVANLGGATPDLALLFVSPAHSNGLEQLAAQVRASTGARDLLGCTGETIVGRAQEVESGPALSLWLASFESVTVRTFRLTARLEEGDMSFAGTPDLPSTREEIEKRKLSLLLLGDPFSFPADHWLKELNERHPGLRAFGGLASGGMRPGQNRLFEQDSAHDHGAVGCVLEGVPVETVVSQGCRPVGGNMVITRSEDNVIRELAGKPPLARLQEVFEKGSREEQELIQKAAQSGGLQVGQVVDERISKPGRGDFLIRNVMGTDASSGAITIGDQARRGRTMRFHVRDAQTADEDLQKLLQQASEKTSPAGALLFSCNGRGTRLFPTEHHDALCVDQRFSGLPLAGFFAQGEVGSVGGSNFLHGFTASLALFGAE